MLNGLRALKALAFVFLSLAPACATDLNEFRASAPLRQIVTVSGHHADMASCLVDRLERIDYGSKWLHGTLPTYRIRHLNYRKEVAIIGERLMGSGPFVFAPSPIAEWIMTQRDQETVSVSARGTGTGKPLVASSVAIINHCAVTLIKGEHLDDTP